MTRFCKGQRDLPDSLFFIAVYIWKQLPWERSSALPSKTAITHLSKWTATREVGRDTRVSRHRLCLTPALLVLAQLHIHFAKILPFALSSGPAPSHTLGSVEAAVEEVATPMPITLLVYPGWDLSGGSGCPLKSHFYLAACLAVPLWGVLLCEVLADVTAAPIDLLFRGIGTESPKLLNPKKAVGDLCYLTAAPSTSHCGNWALFMKMNEDFKPRASTPWTELPLETHCLPDYQGQTKTKPTKQM